MKAAEERLAALTLQKPWAECIVRGTKRVENRSWRPRSKAPFWLAIHAGRSVDPELTGHLFEVLAEECPRMRVLRRQPEGIVGMARISAVLRFGARLMDTPWASGPWCWMIEEVVEFPEPVPCRGQRGLWPVPDEVRPHVLQAFIHAHANAAMEVVL